MKNMSDGAKLFALAFGMLSVGAVRTLTQKAQIDTCAPSLVTGLNRSKHAIEKCGTGDGREKTAPFEKPWLNNMMTFSGEALIILVFLVQSVVGYWFQSQNQSKEIDGHNEKQETELESAGVSS